MLHMLGGGGVAIPLFSPVRVLNEACSPAPAAIRMQSGGFHVILINNSFVQVKFVSWPCVFILLFVCFVFFWSVLCLCEEPVINIFFKRRAKMHLASFVHLINDKTKVNMTIFGVFAR